MKHLSRFSPILFGLSLLAFGPLGCSDDTTDGGAGGGGGQATTSSTASTSGAGGTGGSGGAGGGATSSSGSGGAGGGATGSGGGGGAGGSATDCVEVVVSGFGYLDYADPMNNYQAALNPNDDANPRTFKLSLDDATAETTFDLSAAPNNNASTCAQCVSITTDDGAPRFFVSKGSLKVDLFDSVLAKVTATLSDATIVEVTVDGAGVSTPVAGGACYHITSALLEDLLD